MLEDLKDIIAVVSILIKFGHDDILENKALFIAFLNELGMTISNKKVTATSLYNATQEITHRQRRELVSEFNVGHEPIYRKLTMVLNEAKLA